VVQVLWLILNLLKENFPDVAVDTQSAQGKLTFGQKYRFQHNGILRFHHTEFNRDTEADISRGDRGATSLGEEMFEEAR